MVNQKKKAVPMEVTEETIEAFGINPNEVSYQYVGSRKKLVHLYEVDEDIYYELMRPEWRDIKREERKQQELSINQMNDDYNYEFEDNNSDVLENILNEELIDDVRRTIKTLSEKDRLITELFMYEGMSEAKIGKEIGMSQKGVNKRKKKIFKELAEKLKNYRN